MEGAGAYSAVTNRPDFDLPPIDLVFGRSEAMQQLKAMIDRVTGTNIPVLIQGESGTGKEVIAKLVHLRSPRARGPFVNVSCAAIPASLLETELFGYEKGAFTGAYASKQGRVEKAQGGTLLLDEIADLAIELQAKLLQLLQDGEFCRIGGQDQRKVDIRVICTTSRDLERAIADGTFRQDLYYRISGMQLRVPALRERPEDIPLIADYLLRVYNQMFGTQARALTPSLHRHLQKHYWPGNVRELENLIRRYTILGNNSVITGEARPQTPSAFLVTIPDDTLSLKALNHRAQREVESKVILKALQMNNWSRKKTAEVLGISYRTLLYKIRNAGIRIEGQRDVRPVNEEGNG